MCSSSNFNITAYGGSYGCYNTISNGGMYVPTISGTYGTLTGSLTTTGLLRGALPANPQMNSTAGSPAQNGNTGNICPLVPYTYAYNFQFGSSSGGATYNGIAGSTAPFAGGSPSFLTAGYCAGVNGSYNTAILNVTGKVNSSIGYNDGGAHSYGGTASSNSGASGGACQAQGIAGASAKGIVIIAIPTANLY